MDSDLGRSLRVWRSQAHPPQPEGQRHRRVRGLRREEVAAAAGISINYLIGLEQGRATSPSLAVVEALASSLQLGAARTEHLHRLAGLPTPRLGVRREVDARCLRALATCAGSPAGIFDPAWSYVAANELAESYLGGPVVGENAAIRQFLGPKWMQLEAADDRRFDREVVGDLHRQLGRHPDDQPLCTVVDRLLQLSERFRTLWEERPVADASTSDKTAHHPALGWLRVHCDVLELAESDLRLVVWSGVDAEASERLAQLTQAPTVRHATAET